MKNSIKILFVALLAVGLTSCLKESSYKPYDGQAMLDKEAPILRDFVKNNEEFAGAILDSSGIWYKIIEEGAQPEDEDFYKYTIDNSNNLAIPRISVKYVGRLVGADKPFEEGTTEKVKDEELPYANEFISGWVRAFLPKTVEKEGEILKVGGLTEFGLQKGTKIRLLIPSPYAYQDNSSTKIPADSPLDFTIEVLNVLPPPSATSSQ